MRNYGLSFIMLGLFLNGCQSMPDQRVMAVNAGIQSKQMQYSTAQARPNQIDFLKISWKIDGSIS